MSDKPDKLEFHHNGGVESHSDIPGSRRVTMRSPHWRPLTDLFETETNYTVRVEIPGMREQDFAIELNGRELTIRGNRQDSSERRAFHQMEIRFGEFILNLEIPAQISGAEVEAMYQNGFLFVILPKMKPRFIPINNEEAED